MCSEGTAWNTVEVLPAQREVRNLLKVSFFLDYHVQQQTFQIQCLPDFFGFRVISNIGSKDSPPRSTSVYQNKASQCNLKF